MNMIYILFAAICAVEAFIWLWLAFQRPHFNGKVAWDLGHFALSLFLAIYFAAKVLAP